MTTWLNSLRLSYVVIIATTLFITGCITIITPPKTFYRIPLINPVLKSHIDRFERLYNVKILQLRLQFKDNLPRTKNKITLGICQFKTVPTIYLNKSQYFQLSPLQQEVVVFHELGHCILGLAHLNQLMDDGCPTTVMYPELLSTICYERHRRHYLRHLGNAVRLMP